MSEESLTHLNINTLIGNTDARGTAWHYRTDLQGGEPNADLSFMTRKEAERAPGKVQNQNLIDVAIGIAAAEVGVNVEAAEARLRDAALRAGVSLLQVAGDIVSTHQRQHQDEG